MSFSIDSIVASKLVALAIFFPVYLGALVYAMRGANQARFTAYAAIPLHDDDPALMGQAGDA